jgi:biopolymer transport protein ExbD
MGSNVVAAPARVGRFPQNSEINVVPFVDVMLVLLIIFMVAAPMATTSINVDVPPSPTSAPPNPKDPIFVSVTPRGVFVGEVLTDLAGLGAAVRTAAKGDLDNRILMRADEEVLYGDVTGAMEAVRTEGFDKVVVIGEEM